MLQRFQSLQRSRSWDFPLRKSQQLPIIVQGSAGVIKLLSEPCKERNQQGASVRSQTLQPFLESQPVPVLQGSGGRFDHGDVGLDGAADPQAACSSAASQQPWPRSCSDFG